MTAPIDQVERQTPAQAKAQLTAAKLAAIIALVQAQAKVRQQLTATAVAAALAPFRTFTNWWDAAAVNRAIDQVLRVVQPTQRQMAQVTDAYLARVVSQMTGRTVRPVGAADVTRMRRQITAQVARELVDGTRTPAFVVLGEFNPENGTIDRAPTIDAPAALAIPEPAATAAGRAAGATSARTQAEQLRATARQQAQALTEARRTTQSSTSAQLAERMRQILAQRQAQATPTRTPTGNVTRSVDADDVVDPALPYGRIADQYRYQVVAEGISERQARQRALTRIEAVAQTDITLAVRAQVRRSLTRIRGVDGYRRIVRPELSETGPCGLCVVAADRIYHIEDLHPIHDRCVCDVLPIIGTLDPGLILNSDDLRTLYGEAGTTSGRRQGVGRPGLKRLRVALAEHGELGPVLVDADHRSRGPVDVARTRHPDRAVRDTARLASFEERLDALLARRGRGEDGLDRAIEWQTERIGQLRRGLGAAAPPAPGRRRAPAGV